MTIETQVGVTVLKGLKTSLLALTAQYIFLPLSLIPNAVMKVLV
jgi:hypothetical protein